MIKAKFVSKYYRSGHTSEDSFQSKIEKSLLEIQKDGGIVKDIKLSSDPGNEYCDSQDVALIIYEDNEKGNMNDD